MILDSFYVSINDKKFKKNIQITMKIIFIKND